MFDPANGKSIEKNPKANPPPGSRTGLPGRHNKTDTTQKNPRKPPMTTTINQHRIHCHTGKIRDMTDLLEEIAKLTPQKNAIAIPAKIIAEELYYLECEVQQLAADYSAAGELRDALDGEVTELKAELTRLRLASDPARLYF